MKLPSCCLQLHRKHFSVFSEFQFRHADFPAVPFHTLVLFQRCPKTVICDDIAILSGMCGQISFLIPQSHHSTVILMLPADIRNLHLVEKSVSDTAVPQHFSPALCQNLKFFQDKIFFLLFKLPGNPWRPFVYSRGIGHSFTKEEAKKPLPVFPPLLPFFTPGTPSVSCVSPGNPEAPAPLPPRMSVNDSFVSGGPARGPPHNPATPRPEGSASS